MGLKKIKKLILHIGSEKTGTTSIQSMLSLNRELLESKSVRIPMFLGRLNHRYAEYAFRSNETQDDFDMNRGIFDDPKAKKELKDAIKSDWENKISTESLDTWLISCEHFQSRLHHQQEIKNLWRFNKNLFEEISIIIYLRSPISTAYSHLSTAIKGGAILNSFNITPESVSAICNHKEILERWLSVVPKNCLKVRLFDKTKFTRNDLYADFLDSCELDLHDQIQIPMNANSSLSLRSMRLMMLLNQRIPTYFNNMRNPARQDIHHYLEKYSVDSPPLVPSIQKAEEFKQYYRESDEYVRTNFFPHHDQELWPYLGGRDQNTCDTESQVIFTEEEKEVADLISIIWVDKQRSINSLNSKLNALQS